MQLQLQSRDAQNVPKLFKPSGASLLQRHHVTPSSGSILLEMMQHIVAVHATVFISLRGASQLGESACGSLRGEVLHAGSAH